jgi:hypothetical protein
MRVTQYRLAAGLFGAAACAYGGMSAPRSLADLAQSADAIVIATASWQGSSGSAAAVTLQLTRVVNGDLSLSGGPVVVALQGVSPAGTITPGTPIPVASSGALWFLQRSSGGWAVLPVASGASASHAFLPVPGGPLLPAYAYQSSAPLLDKLASELCSAIEGADGGEPQLASLHLGLLDQLGSSVVALLYQRMATSSSLKQQILGLAGQVRGGSSSALASAAQLASSASAPSLETGVLLWSIQNEFRAADANSAAVLGGIAASPASGNAALRHAAAHALAAIHTAGAAPYLAALLDDPDTEIEAEGVRGLGSLALGLPIQTTAGVPSLAHLQMPANAPLRTDAVVANFALSTDAIQQKIATYVPFWKSWWTSNQAAIGH